VVIDADTATAAAAANAQDSGPVPVEARTIEVLQQPWFLPLAILVLFAALATIGLLAFRLISDSAMQPRKVQRRVDSYGVAPTATTATTPEEQSAFARRAVAAAEHVVSQRDPNRVLEVKLAAAGIPLKPAEWVVLHASIAFSAALILAALTGLSPLWAVTGFAMGAAFPYIVVDRKATKRRKEFAAALPDVLQLLSGSVATGYSFPQAIDTVAAESDGVVAAEFNRAVAEARLGVPIEDALMDVAKRMDSRDFEWVVMAVAINRRVGGNLAEVLRTVSKTLRERERVQRQIKTLTAEGRISAIVLVALPLLLLAYMIIVRPDYIVLMISSPLALLVTGVTTALIVIGIIWMRRMIRVEV
jgi:tight adherence protein B